MSGFQSVVPAKMGQALISAGQTTLYTVPASSIAMLKDIDIANDSTAAVQVTVWLVPSGAAVGPSYILIPGISLPANSILQWTGTQNLAAGDYIVGFATGGPCSMKASGGVAT